MNKKRKITIRKKKANPKGKSIKYKPSLISKK